MNRAEKILMKHVNDHDLNFMFHDQKQMYNEVLNAINEALGLAHVSDSRQGEICQICHKEMDEDYANVCSDCDDSHLDD